MHPFESSLPFLGYLDRWKGELGERSLGDLASRPDAAALVCVDVTNGFCHEGPLASERVRGIVAPITDLMQRLWERGGRHILLVQDAHDPAAVEFGQFPPHCVRGSAEAETVPEIKALPFYDQLRLFQKNSIDSALDTGLDSWCNDHREVATFIVVGDCTDLCTYLLAMHLRLVANARQLHRRVVVPADCVDTYDMPVQAAQDAGAMPHDARLLHAVFLYSMALNGVEVVRHV